MCSAQSRDWLHLPFPVHNRNFSGEFWMVCSLHLDTIYGRTQSIQNRLCSLGRCQGTKTMKSSYSSLVCGIVFKPKTVCSPTEPLRRPWAEAITALQRAVLGCCRPMSSWGFSHLAPPRDFSPCIWWHNAPLFLLNHFFCSKYLPIIHCVILNKPLRGFLELPAHCTC